MGIFVIKVTLIMTIQEQLAIRSPVLKGHVNQYAIFGLVISILSILFASLLVSYQMTGGISLSGFLQAQATNPAIWALDLTPFMFAYWGQAFCHGLVNKAETIIEDTTKELVNKSGDLELKLKYESNHDSLTNLPNSRLLSLRINQGIKQIKKDEELALIILNINDFKGINYSFGNFNANNLLLQFTERLKTILLEPYMLQASMGMNMVARLQGAEFAILIPRLRKEHNLDAILAGLINATSTAYMIDGNNIEMKTTAGVALYPRHGDNDESLIHHSTLCLLHAEKEGQRFAIYHPDMNSDYKTKRIMLKEISNAIDKEELELLYKPIFELNKENIIGTEAVINFNHEKYGMLNAEKIISLVEGTKLMKKLTFLTLKNAVQQLDLWHKANNKIYITVNVLNATDMEIPKFIESLLKEHNLPAKYLKIELTEKACLSNQTYSINFLKQIAEMGITVGISDFCSGYSSFVYLTNFPISDIKIDKSFVMKMVQDKKKLTVVRAIIKLADAMKLVVFADGINDEAILAELKKLGCLYGEGAYFSDAVNAGDFTELLGSAEPKHKSVE